MRVTAHTEPVSTEVLNADRYVAADQDASDVQSEIDAAESNDESAVVVYGKSASWGDTITLPSDLTVILGPNLTITPPSDHSFESFDIGPNTVYSVIKAEGEKNTELKGPATIDCLNIPDDEETWAGVNFHDCDDSLTQDITVENLIPDPNDTSERHYGVQFTDCEDCQMVRCFGNNTGYEGISIRANCVRCDAIDSGGEDNRVHIGQMARMTPEGYGSPHNCRFIRPRGDDRVIIHGHTDDGPIFQCRIIEPQMDRVHIFGDVRQCRVRGGTLQEGVRLQSQSGEKIDYLYLDDIDIRSSTAMDPIIEVLADSGGHFDHIYADRFTTRGSGSDVFWNVKGAADATIGNVYLRNSTVEDVNTIFRNVDGPRDEDDPSGETEWDSATIVDSELDDPEDVTFFEGDIDNAVNKDYSPLVIGPGADIQDAIDAVDELGGGEVRLEAGVYEEQIDIPSGVVVIGANPKEVELVNHDSEDPVIEVGGPLANVTITNDDGPNILMDSNEASIRNCRIRDNDREVIIAGDRDRVVDNDFSGVDFTLESGVEGNVIVANANIGDVTGPTEDNEISSNS